MKPPPTKCGGGQGDDNKGKRSNNAAYYSRPAPPSTSLQHVGRPVARVAARQLPEDAP